MTNKNQESTTGKTPVHKRLWFRLTALALAVIMVFSIWAIGAVYVRIQPKDDQDAAAQYLIDNTEYIQQDELERLEDKVQTYVQPPEEVDYYQLAGTQIADGKYAEALDSIEKCQEADNGADPDFSVDLEMKRGCLLVLLERYQEAAEALEQVLLKDSRQPEAYLVLAQIYAELGNPEGMIPVLTAYLNLCPEDSEIRMLLAQLLFEKGSYEAALQEYDQLLQMDGMEEHRQELQFLKALVSIQLEQYTEAKELLLSLSESGAVVDKLDYYLAVCYLSEEAYETAEAVFTRSIEAGQMLQLSYYSRAICRLMKPNYDYDGAVQDLHSTIAYEGTDHDETIAEQANELLAAMQTEG